MIRVLQVVTYMGRGGLETMLMNYYRHIDRSKIQFDFLVHREFRADYDDEIEELGGRIYRLPVLNPFSRVYKKALSSIFDEHPEYQVIHVHQDCMSSVILKEAQKHGVKVRIAHSHNANQDHNMKYLLKLYYRRYIPQYSTNLMACSEEAGKWMFGKHPFEVLNNAIDAKKYTFNREIRTDMRLKLNITEDKILIGHVGRFNPQKNHEFLIDIFDAIQKKIPAMLLLVGDGNQRQAIEAKVKNLNLGDQVIFAGVRTDVAELMQAMDVFVFPSNYEGLPVTLIEAQATGLPCLISDKVPIECKKTDLVQQNLLSTGADAWAEAAIRIAKTERRNTYEEIKAAGFDIEENAKRLQEFYLRADAGEKKLCLY